MFFEDYEDSEIFKSSTAGRNIIWRAFGVFSMDLLPIFQLLSLLTASHISTLCLLGIFMTFLNKDPSAPTQNFSPILISHCLSFNQSFDWKKIKAGGFKTRCSISAKYCKEINNPSARFSGSPLGSSDDPGPSLPTLRSSHASAPWPCRPAFLVCSLGWYCTTVLCPGPGAKLEAWPLSSLPPFCRQHSCVPLCTRDLLLMAPSLSTPRCFLLFPHGSVTPDRSFSSGWSHVKRLHGLLTTPLALLTHPYNFYKVIGPKSKVKQCLGLK